MGVRDERELRPRTREGVFFFDEFATSVFASNKREIEATGA